MYHTSVHENSIFVHIVIGPGQRHLEEIESGQVDLVIVLEEPALLLVNTWPDEDFLS